MLQCRNPLIRKRASFMISAQSEDEAREIFNKSFIASSGMQIVEIKHMGVIYVIDTQDEDE